MKTKLFLFALCVFVSTQAQNIHNGHEYVDLGLPSGTLWATCNVGATYSEQYGGYFAWGEVIPKNFYETSNYTYASRPVTLPLSADVAHVHWGGNWRMPTEEECRELLDKCVWTKSNCGYEVKGSNGNSIFLPAAGCHSYSVYGSGVACYYWSSSISLSGPNSAYYLAVPKTSSYFRYYGLPVRPVYSKSEKIETKSSQTKSHTQSQNKPKKPALTK